MEKRSGSSNRTVPDPPCPAPSAQGPGHHDSLLSGSLSLSLALLAAKISPAQAVSVPPQPIVAKRSFLPGAVLRLKGFPGGSDGKKWGCKESDTTERLTCLEV